VNSLAELAGTEAVAQISLPVSSALLLVILVSSRVYSGQAIIDGTYRLIPAGVLRVASHGLIPGLKKKHTAE
jgi:hypothetical protein